MTKRAAFLDRDGTITDMVYYPEHGMVDSPCSPSQLVLIEGAAAALRVFQDLGYKLIVVSNQPGIAKDQFTAETHHQMVARLDELLSLEGVRLTAQYYCLHHPHAHRAQFRQVCDCRKPRPGLLRQAAEEHDVSLPASITIGDGLTDVQAGKDAGTETILLTTLNSLTTRLMVDLDAEPGFIARNLRESVEHVQLLQGRAVR